MGHGLWLSILVGCGGFCGSITRYGLSLYGQKFSIEWPIGTMASNVLGCLLIGVITALASRGESLSPELRLALATGFCGGFTTMSSFIYESSEMVRVSEYFHAALYFCGTLLLSFGAFVAGVAMIRFLRSGGL